MVFLRAIYHFRLDDSVGIKLQADVKCAATSEKIPSDRSPLRRIRSACTFIYAKFLHVGNEEPDQTAAMHRWIWIFLGRTYQKVYFLKLLFKWRVNERHKGVQHVFGSKYISLYYKTQQLGSLTYSVCHIGDIQSSYYCLWV